MADTTLTDKIRAFLDSAGWDTSAEPLTGDASPRKYFRLRKGQKSAILMNASQARASVVPFVRIAEHLLQLGFSAPTILARDEIKGLLLLEDFGDANFASLLDDGAEPEKLFALGTDVLITLHKHPQAIPGGLRAYGPEKMLEDIELFLDCCTSGISENGRAEFRKVWREVLPVAHQAPASLLLRDYHAANLMLLPDRDGVRQAGLLDFQDAYQGPVTYDLVSLLQDARRDVPEDLREKMIARYLAQFPALDSNTFKTSLAILAALRHTRILAIFERLSRHEGKHEYKRLHSPRVERLLQKTLRHPKLADVKRWFDQYARQN
ncbi:MAG TPA: phosphotransferase [Candidatus Saccharimonadales bacterium]|nr:phosphotransferase [Candidatus Saccharimonadales bacterium]